MRIRPQHLASRNGRTSSRVRHGALSLPTASLASFSGRTLRTLTRASFLSCGHPGGPAACVGKTTQASTRGGHHNPHKPLQGLAAAHEYHRPGAGAGNPFRVRGTPGCRHRSTPPASWPRLVGARSLGNLIKVSPPSFRDSGPASRTSLLRPWLATSYAKGPAIPGLLRPWQAAPRTTVRAQATRLGRPRPSLAAPYAKGPAQSTQSTPTTRAAPATRATSGTPGTPRRCPLVQCPHNPQGAASGDHAPSGRQRM